MKEINLRNIHVVASLVLILGAPLVAKAANYSFDADSGALRVSYSDINLNSNEGITVLYRRLQRASRLACGSATHPEKGLARASKSKACYNEVLSRVVAKVGNVKLTALHES